MTPNHFSAILCAAVILSACCCGGNRKFAGKACALETSAKFTTVSTVSGPVAGYIDDGVYTYKGIPYAKAERFMPPADPDSWTEVRHSRAYGPTCPQDKRSGWWSDDQAFAMHWDDGFPDEDCLRVNVWTSGINDNGKRPVMVWMHGGGFRAGSGQELISYDGAALARDHGVVVVTLNHRLNVLGFLDLSAYGAKYAKSGNAGMLDIVKALEWVRDNIAAFGGDPSNVTIFGQSGGGGKVCTLMAMPSAKGLFGKAIVQSGSITELATPACSRRVGTYTVENLDLPNMLDYDIRNGRTYMYTKAKPIFPFGYGLSYTSFKYSKLKVRKEEDRFVFSFDLKNTGSRDGEEVVQLYAKFPGDDAAKRLRGFERIAVAAGETVRAEISVPLDDLKLWDSENHCWAVPKGRSKIMIGASSEDIRLKTRIKP